MEATRKINSNLVYKVIIAVLLLIIALLVWQIFIQKNKTNVIIVEKEVKNKVLQEELNSLITEHDSIKVEYAQLTDKLSSKDSIISAQAAEIKILIDSQADYKRIKKKLNYLRDITQNYVREIDSLYKENKMLREENLAISNKYDKERKRNVALEEDKTVLKEKVNLASLLKATNISTMGVRMRAGDKEIVTDKASKVDKIKVCFTLLENLVAEPGPRSIYIRVARPDNKIIAFGTEDIYSFEYNGQRLQYSMKKDIDYANKTMNICIYWEKRDKTTEAMKGVYTVTLYCENYLIGESRFALR
ncbi:MAG: hypothetical protein KA792_07115 [Bacteroidales bacterium]|nr:hypothetical protein [Bacteroidales bacterium]